MVGSHSNISGGGGGFMGRDAPGKGAGGGFQRWQTQYLAVGKEADAKRLGGPPPLQPWVLGTPTTRRG